MDRTLYREEHDLFRQSFRRFVEREVKPHQARWMEAGMVDREAWRKAGQGGFLCPCLEEAYGGPGGDFLHSAVVIEELAEAYESGFAMSLHSDIVAPYIHEFGTEEQKQRWLPGCASGEIVTAIAMTEPGTGSDLASLAATAVRDGDTYILNGAKTFISNGILCDLCVVAARTDPDPARAHRGISLFAVEAGTPGFLKAFGKPISRFQNTQFKLAECATKVEVGRAFLDRLVAEHVAGKHLVKECSMAKLWQTEMLGQVVDECLQLFGGYGYMLEYPIARAYRDARVQRIFAGTNEIMKVIIAKQLDL